MEWALIILFSTAALLLILSYLKMRQESKEERREIDIVHFSVMEEVNKLQEHIRTIEMDAEITAHVAGIQQIPPKKRVLIREMLDLYRRGYTLEGIAEKKQMNQHEVKQLLSPYMLPNDERGKVANDS